MSLDIEDHESHAIAIGSIVGNLLSVEFGMRFYLWKRNSSSPTTDLVQIKAGDVVPENELTDYDSLSQIVTKYNQAVAKEHQVNERIVRLRDALAHGRVFSNTREFPLRLIKFGKAKNNRVPVTFAETMDTTWCQQQKQFTAAELAKVEAALSQLE